MSLNSTFAGLLTSPPFQASALPFVNTSTAAHAAVSGGGSHGPIGVALLAWNFAEVEFTLVASLFFLAVAIGKILYHHWHLLASWIPESCMLIFLGTVLGLIVLVVDQASIRVWHMDHWVFHMILLPPIMLESAYCLHNRSFADNISEVLMYAVVGTVLAFGCVGVGIYGVSVAGLMGSPPLPLSTSLLFASYIVAVDPVAILAIFQDLGVYQCLYVMVVGESILNDGIAMVLYNMMQAFSHMTHIYWTEVIVGIFSFFTVCLGGVLIGILIGAASSFILRYTRKERVVEPLIMFVTAYLSYVVAVLVNWSGVISIISCGLVQARYAFHNVSHKSCTTIKYFSKMASSLTEALIFLYLGCALVSPEHQWHTGLCLWSLLLCIVARFVIMYSLTAILNLWRVRSITWTEQFIMSYGGLRGAFAFSLATTLPPDAFKNILVTTTLFIIIVTTVIQGILAKPLVKFLRIRLDEKHPMSLFGEINEQVLDHACAGIESVVGLHGGHTVREILSQFDDIFVKRALQREPATRSYEISKLYQKLSLKMHFALLKDNNEDFNEALKKLPPGLVDRSMFRNASHLDLQLLRSNESTMDLQRYHAGLQRTESRTSLASSSHMTAPNPNVHYSRPNANGLSGRRTSVPRIDITPTRGPNNDFDPTRNHPAEERASEIVEGAEEQRLLFRRECNRLDSYNDDDQESGEVMPADGLGIADLAAGIDENAEERVLQLLKRKSYLLYRLQKVKCKQARQNLARKQSVASFGSNGGRQRKQSLTSMNSPQGVGGGATGRLTGPSGHGTGASRQDLHKVSSAAQLALPNFHRVVTEGGFFHSPTNPTRGPHAPSSLTNGPPQSPLRAKAGPRTVQAAFKQANPQMKDEDNDHDSDNEGAIQIRIQGAGGLESETTTHRSNTSLDSIA